MLFQLKIHMLARQEHLGTSKWYESQQAGLGDRYLDAVEQKVQQILSNPEYFSFLRKHYRHARVDGFPFTIVYEFFPKRKLIHIAAIFHSSRNPRMKFRKEE